MTKTLTLLIASDWPRERRECPWILRDAAGRILEQGCSEPAHWPGVRGRDEAAAPREPLCCELLLCGAQVAAQRVQLPRTPLGRSPQVIAAALEDSLLEDGEQLQFAALAEDKPVDTRVAVAVVSRARLAAILRSFAELGLSPRSAWPLGFTLPQGMACLCGGEMTFALPQGHFVTLDADAGLAAWVEHLKEAGVGLPLPCAVPDRLPSERTAALVGQEENAGRLRRVAGFAEALNVPSGAGFLSGELAAPRQPVAVLRHFRPVARLALAFALAVALLSAVQWGWFSWQARGHRQAIERDFRHAFPQAALVDPLLQMQRQVDAARRAAGQLAPGDFLRLLEPLAGLSQGGIELRQLDYENGRLRLAARLPAERLRQLAEQCRRLGVTLEVLSEDARADGATVVLALSEGARR
jgi:general secretion pathway protein L